MLSALEGVFVQNAIANNWLVTLGVQSTGTFTLTWNSVTSSTIAYNALPAAVLAALPSGGAGWTVTGVAGGPYVIGTPPVPLGALTANFAALTTPANASIAPSLAFTNGAHLGSVVDCGLYGNMFRSLEFVISAGTVTDGTHTVTVQECATLAGTYTNIDPVVGGVSGSRINGVVSGNQIVPQVLPVLGPGNSNSLIAFGAVHTLRYVQMVITTAGATTGGLFSAVAVCDSASKGPVARA